MAEITNGTTTNETIKVVIRIGSGRTFFMKDSAIDLTLTKYFSRATAYDISEDYGKQELKNDIDHIKKFELGDISLWQITEKSNSSILEIPVEDYKF